MSEANQEFQAPPPPSAYPATEAPTGPTMSTPEALANIFFEPSRVFEALRNRPRFLVAGVITVLLTAAVTFTMYQSIDMEQYIRDKMERSPRSAAQTEQQKEMGVKIGKSIGMAVPLIIPFTIAAGAALYLLAVIAFGGKMTYRQSLSVWCYSGLPPSVLATVVAILVLFLKSPDTIDPEHLLLTNPGAFLSQESSPALVAFLSQFDVVRFYGMFLAAIGLRKMAKLSSTSAWAIVIIFWLIILVLSVGSRALFG